jgi:hypothetical protein
MKLHVMVLQKMLLDQIDSRSSREENNDRLWYVSRSLQQKQRILLDFNMSKGYRLCPSYQSNIDHSEDTLLYKIGYNGFLLHKGNKRLIY